MGRDTRHAAHVDADRRQGAPGARADGQPLVAGAALRVGAGSHHLAHARRRPRARARVRLSRPHLARAHVRRRRTRGRARAAHRRELLRGDHGRARCSRRACVGARASGRGGRCDPVPGRPPRHVRRGCGTTILDRAHSGASGDDAVSCEVPRQGEPGALLLGRARPRGHPLLGPPGAQASRRGAQLRRLGAATRVQPRGEQLRLLARRRRRGRVLLVRVSRARRLLRLADEGRRRVLRRRARRVRPAVPRCGPRPTPTRCSSPSSRTPTTPRPTSRAGIVRPWRSRPDADRGLGSSGRHRSHGRRVGAGGRCRRALRPRNRRGRDRIIRARELGDRRQRPHADHDRSPDRVRPSLPGHRRDGGRSLRDRQRLHPDARGRGGRSRVSRRRHVGAGRNEGGQRRRCRGASGARHPAGVGRRHAAPERAPRRRSDRSAAHRHHDRVR